MRLLTFKLMKISYDLTLSSSVALGTFEVLSGYTWPVASVLVGAHRTLPSLQEVHWAALV